MQDYTRALWSSLQSQWVPPPDARADGVAVLVMAFDGYGDSGPPEIVEANDPALRASVEKATHEAELPELSETLRACLAGRRIKFRFNAYTP